MGRVSLSLSMPPCVCVCVCVCIGVSVSLSPSSSLSLNLRVFQALCLLKPGLPSLPLALDSLVLILTLADELG